MMGHKPHPVLTASEEAREIADTWRTNAPAIRMARAFLDLEEQLKAYGTALREIELASRKPGTAPGHFGYIARVVLSESNPASEPEGT